MELRVVLQIEREHRSDISFVGDKSCFMFKFLVGKLVQVEQARVHAKLLHQVLLRLNGSVQEVIP